MARWLPQRSPEAEREEMLGAHVANGCHKDARRSAIPSEQSRSSDISVLNCMKELNLVARRNAVEDVVIVIIV